MSTFEQRERSYEGKFIQDQEKIFKIRARRRKFLGLWAAEKMHKNEVDSLSYALDIVKFGVGNITNEQIAARISDDLKAAGVKLTLQEIQDKMVQLTQKAIETLERDGEI